MASLQKLEAGLTAYYATFNKKYTGQIKAFMNDCDIDEDQLEEDFAVTDDFDDCMVILDWDGIDDFPLDPNITADDAQKEKFEIMKYCYENGQPPAPAPVPASLSTSISPKTIKLATSQIKPADVKRTSKIYQALTPNIHAQCSTEPDVMYLLTARSKNNNFPVIQTMHDAFTRDRIDKMLKSQTILGVLQWLVRLPLYKALLKKSKASADKLAAGMKGFVNRICPLIRLNTQNYIDDDPAKIANYVASTSQFIQKLLEKENALPPFQVDMIIAVKDVKLQVDDDDDDDDDDHDDHDDHDDDVDDDDDDDDDKTDDIGDVIDKLKKNKCTFQSQPVDDAKEQTLRPMMGLYKNFRGKLNKSNNKPSPNDKKTYHKSFDAAYPHKKRFNIFVDRRKNVPTDKDKVTFFEPPHYCDTVPYNDKDPYAPEWFIESARRCLIPVQGPNNTINATEAYNGGILTFSFHVEAKDKIKCYMFWSAGVQRFYPEDLVKVFKYVFHPDVYNKFIKSQNKSGTISKIAKNIHIVDKEFESFYKSLTKKQFPKKIDSLFKKK